MTAAEALAHAKAAEVIVSLYSKRLKIGSRGATPAAVIEALKAAKPQIISLLRPDASGANGIDYRRVFNERFADRTAQEVEPELARLEAFDRALSEWLKRSFDLIDATTDTNRCAHCAKAGDDALLPIGPNAHGWHASDSRPMPRAVAQGATHEGARRAFRLRPRSASCMASRPRRERSL